MRTYIVTRTRLVTERFRIHAEDEEAATILLADQMELPSKTQNCELLDWNTEYSERHFDPDWTQQELREYLIEHGWKPEDFRPGEAIPQGVKYINFDPLTPAHIAAARRLIYEHPEWEQAAAKAPSANAVNPQPTNERSEERQQQETLERKDNS